MADQPTRSGADDGAPVAPLTVSELIARSGTSVGRRRAERRESAEATGRQQPVQDDGRPGPERPPLRGGVRRDPVGPPSTPAAPVLPTGWQPAMPAEHVDAPAEPVAPRPTVTPRPWPGPQHPGQQRPTSATSAPSALLRPPAGPSAPARPAPGPSTGPPTAARLAPTPLAPTPTPPTPLAGPSPAAAPASPVLPPRPAMRAVPADAAVATPAVVIEPAHVARVVPPVSVTPAAPPAPPAPAVAPAAPVAAPATPYPSVPTPGVRRSVPLPPIPGRDLPPSEPGRTRREREPARPLSPARRRLRRAALALVALLGVVAAYYVGLYFYVDRSIDRVDALVTDGPEVLAPQLQADWQTYLVVGTGMPGRDGLSAVSTLIAHVSNAGDQAVLVTVPPTALSDTPTCRDSDGEVRPAVTEPFASALVDGGPSCLVRSVQQLTGLRVDHYLALDLDRLPGMVDALGDVTVCLPEPSSVGNSELSLPAGDNQLTGDDVAAYLRPGGTGSDVTGAAAAQREQLVLTSTLRAALAGGTLVDPLTLTRFLSRASDAFTVDADTTLGDVRALGATLGDLPGDAVERATVPVAQVGYVPAGSDQAAVVLDAVGTRELFDAVIDGGRLPAAATEELPAEQAAAADPAAGAAPADQLPDPALADPVPEGTVVTVAPAGVTVDVFDATGDGRTTEVADGLVAGGFRTGLRGVEPAAVDRTVVRYGPAALEPARTVAAAVPGSILLETDEVGGAVQLVIGDDFAGLAPVGMGTPVPTTAAPPTAEAGSGAGACS